MTKTFKNFPELTATLAFDLIDSINALDIDGRTVIADFGGSNVSCSSYVTVSIYEGEDDEFVSETKVRFSDHADYHGSDITYRIDDKVEAVYDDGDYVETRIEEEAYEAILAEAMAFVERAANA